jgi:hypothetical protein
MFRDIALTLYMKYKATVIVGQAWSVTESKDDSLREF